MSATINWRYLPQTNKTIDVGAPSSFLDKMVRAFHTAPPWQLSEVDLPVLRGLEAGFGEKGRDNPFSEIIKRMVDDDGHIAEIEVWPTY